MTWVAAQRVMVRMHFDAGFAAQVYAEPESALFRVDLSAAERAWILRVDPRAWRVDPGRVDRALSVLIQEYPASFRTLVGEVGDALAFRQFFSSESFHACLQERGSMALTFGDWALGLEARGEVRGEGLRSLLRLEQAIARLWRGAGRLPPALGKRGNRGTRWRLSPDRALLVVGAGTADRHEEIHRALVESGRPRVQAVVSSRAEPLPGRVDEAEPEYLLLELGRHEGPRVEYPTAVVEIGYELHEFLRQLDEPREAVDLDRLLLELGLGEDEAAEWIDAAIGEGTLIPVATSSRP